MEEIVERAREEYELTDDSYREILRRTRRDGDAKMARMDSSTYVYYPASCSDPPDACYVRGENGKREPESELESAVSAEESAVSAER